MSLASSVDRCRSLLLANSEPGVSLPPLQPATDAELAAAEAELGHPLPPELRELYKITREGIVGLFELTNPADLQRSNKVSRGGWKELLFEIEEGERGVEGLKDWPGERPPRQLPLLRECRGYGCVVL